jgi:phosphoribosylformylglycinamidine synthase
MKPKALIIRTAGTNCDRELAHAFELAGAEAVTMHLNELIGGVGALREADLVGFPGGFSFGDDIAAGRIFANRVRHHLLGPLKAAIDRGVPMIGVCNGFQVMVKLGLLPDPHRGDFPEQTATLADNTGGRFIARWVSVEAPEDSVCLWTRGLGGFELPIAHGEGRFLPIEGSMPAELRSRGQVALRYAAASGGGVVDNPNGSLDDIAGICDSTGLLLGLMPHPERYTSVYQHPQWTRRSREWRKEKAVGLRLFCNAVEHVACKSRVGC